MRLLKDIKDAGLSWRVLWNESTADERAILVFGPILTASIGPAAIWLWSIN